MINIEDYLQRKQDLINQALDEYLSFTGPAAVLSAMRYSIEAGGKRLRPILTIAVAESLGNENDAIIDVACALEMIHTYSLIHDDLPAMDNSSLRRGKPTGHLVYGEAVAILAGDALLTLAFEIAAKYGLQKGRAEKAIQIVAEMSTAAGAAGMIGGQVLDLEAESAETSVEVIEKIAEMKTGALLRAAVLCGAIAADASVVQLKALTAYADNIGPAFQIVDDLLDYESMIEELGKPVGADQVHFKATYPALLGNAEARQRAESFYQNALAALEDLNCTTELLSELARKIVYRKY